MRRSWIIRFVCITVILADTMHGDRSVLSSNITHISRTLARDDFDLPSSAVGVYRGRSTPHADDAERECRADIASPRFAAVITESGHVGNEERAKPGEPPNAGITPIGRARRIVTR